MRKMIATAVVLALCLCLTPLAEAEPKATETLHANIASGSTTNLISPVEVWIAGSNVPSRTEEAWLMPNKVCASAPLGNPKAQCPNSIRLGLGGNVRLIDPGKQNEKLAYLDRERNLNQGGLLGVKLIEKTLPLLLFSTRSRRLF